MHTHTDHIFLIYHASAQWCGHYWQKLMWTSAHLKNV